MSPTDSIPSPSLLPEGRIVGREDFGAIVRQALQAAASEGWQQLLLSDTDFADWPLGERAVVEALNAWSRTGRTLQLLAREFDTLRQRHPRFVGWRTTWSHIVEARACRGASGEGVPSAIWTPAWTLERIDPERSVLVASRSPERKVALRERLDAFWLKGSPAFPATVLGL